MNCMYADQIADEYRGKAYRHFMNYEALKDTLSFPVLNQLINETEKYVELESFWRDMALRISIEGEP